MPRVVIEILLPLVLPTLLYLGWIWLMRRAAGLDAALAWTGLPWLWLAIAGVAVLAGFLVVVNSGLGTAEQGTYVPPRWVDGHIIPGHNEPRGAP